METPHLESVLAFIAFQPNDLHRDATAELVALHAMSTRHEAMRAALERALPRLAHTVECSFVRPTTEWAEHGSMSFENCSCGIRAARALLDAEKPEAERKGD